jgi:hypothetical protein
MIGSSGWFRGNSGSVKGAEPVPLPDPMPAHDNEMRHGREREPKFMRPGCK